MSELGDIVGKNPQRKFVNVSVSKILTHQQGNSAPKFNMQGLNFKSLGSPSSHATHAVALEERIKAAENKLAEKQGELDKLKAQSDQNIAKAQKEGYHKGMAEGRTAAEGELKNKYESSLNTLQHQIKSSLESIQKEKIEVFKTYEEQATTLVIESLKRILNTNTLENEKAIVPVLSRAVKSLGESHGFSIKVNPEDFKSVTDSRDLWLPLNSSFADIKIGKDSRIERGGLIIESEQTSVEVSYQKILTHMEKEFKEIFSHKRQEVTPPEEPVAEQEANSTTPEIPPSPASEKKQEPENPEEG